MCGKSVWGGGERGLGRGAGGGYIVQACIVLSAFVQ